jgi:hypothetical protein
VEIAVELLDQALARQADDQRAGDEERGCNQYPERQQQPRSECQAPRVSQAASARSV